MNSILDSKIFILQWIQYLGCINSKEFNYIITSINNKITHAFIDTMY